MIHNLTPDTDSPTDYSFRHHVSAHYPKATIDSVSRNYWQSLQLGVHLSKPGNGSQTHCLSLNSDMETYWDGLQFKTNFNCCTGFTSRGRRLRIGLHGSASAMGGYYPQTPVSPWGWGIISSRLSGMIPSMRNKKKPIQIDDDFRR